MYLRRIIAVPKWLNLEPSSFTEMRLFFFILLTDLSPPRTHLLCSHAHLPTETQLAPSPSIDVHGSA